MLTAFVHVRDTLNDLMNLSNYGGNGGSLPDRLKGRTREEAIQFLTDRIKSSIADLQEQLAVVEHFAVTEMYEPGADEPSPWNGLPSSLSTEWMLWYSRKYQVSLIKAHEVGALLKRQLDAELPRRWADISEDEPPMTVFNEELKAAGIRSAAISLKWVLWAKYKRSGGFAETHYEAMMLLGKEPSRQREL